MAPEIEKLTHGTEMIDGCKADIYSLGITILKLLAPKSKNQIEILKFLEENKKNSTY